MFFIVFLIVRRYALWVLHWMDFNWLLDQRMEWFVFGIHKNVDVQTKFEQRLAQAMNVINTLSEHVKTFINQ